MNAGPEALTLIGATWLLITWWLGRSTRGGAAVAVPLVDLDNRTAWCFPEPAGPVNRHRPPSYRPAFN